MIQFPPAVRHTSLSIGLVILSLTFGCARGNESRIAPGDVGHIVASLPSLQSSRPTGEAVITERQQLAQPILDAGLDKDWEGQYVAEYGDVRSGVRLVVTADVYTHESAARARAETETEILRKIFSALSDPAITDMSLPRVRAGCSGTAVKHTLIVSEYFVYCQVHTTVIYVQATGAAEAASIDLASAVAVEFADALDAAVNAK